MVQIQYLIHQAVELRQLVEPNVQVRMSLPNVSEESVLVNDEVVKPLFKVNKFLITDDVRWSILQDRQTKPQPSAVHESTKPTDNGLIFDGRVD